MDLRFNTARLTQGYRAWGELPEHDVTKNMPREQNPPYLSGSISARQEIDTKDAGIGNANEGDRAEKEVLSGTSPPDKRQITETDCSFAETDRAGVIYWSKHNRR